MSANAPDQPPPLGPFYKDLPVMLQIAGLVVMMLVFRSNEYPILYPHALWVGGLIGTLGDVLSRRRKRS